MTGTAPPGTGDDPNNNDEDLHDQNDVIWVNDTPGSLYVDADHDFKAIEAQFIETVHLVLNEESNEQAIRPGILISDEFQWYSIVNLKKDVATGKRVRNTDRKNELKAGTIIIGNQPQ